MGSRRLCKTDCHHDSAGSLIVVNDVSMEIARYSHGPHYAVNQHECVKNFFFEPASAAET